MVQRLKVASGFTGGGVWLQRLDPTKYQIVWGIECDSRKVVWYKRNYPTSHVVEKRIQDVDFTELLALYGYIDLWQVSPECTEFSTANPRGEEGPEQLSQAESICRGLEVLRPKYFILENVRGYLRSKSFRMIRRTLEKLEYWDDAQVLNSADMGVPQTRERLILRAVRGEMFGVPQLPPPVGRRVGWYEAIEDLIPTLPGSHFADWQLARLPELVNFNVLMDSKNAGQEWGKRYRVTQGSCVTLTVLDHEGHMPRAFILSDQHSNGGESLIVRPSNEPTFTIDTRSAAKNKAFIVDGQTSEYGRLLTVPHGEQPMFTLKASDTKRPARAWLERGRVVKMTPRALARFMSLTDDYQLPDTNALACEIIGNGWPALMAKVVVDNLTAAWFEEQRLKEVA